MENMFAALKLDNSDFFQNRCSKKFCNIQRKTLVLENLLTKLWAWRPDISNFQKRNSNTCAFLQILWNNYEQLFLQNTSSGCFFAIDNIQNKCLTFHIVFIMAYQKLFSCNDVGNDDNDQHVKASISLISNIL